MAFSVELVEQDWGDGEVSRQIKITDHEGRESYLGLEEALTLSDNLYSLTEEFLGCGDPDCMYCFPTEKE